MCTAGIYHALGIEDEGSDSMIGARCFIEGQLGYILNHKCSAASPPSPSSDGSYTLPQTCITPDQEGFSFIIGCALHPPAHCCVFARAVHAISTRAGEM